MDSNVWSDFVPQPAEGSAAEKATASLVLQARRQAAANRVYRLLRRFPHVTVAFCAFFAVSLWAPLLTNLAFIAAAAAAIWWELRRRRAQSAERAAAIVKAGGHAEFEQMMKIRKSWREVAITTGLARKPRVNRGVGLRAAAAESNANNTLRARAYGNLGDFEYPTIQGIGGHPVGMVVAVKPLMGQDTTSFRKAAEPLAFAWGVDEVRVSNGGNSLINLKVVMRDTLSSPYVRDEPLSAPASAEWVPVGTDEEGNDIRWTLKNNPGVVLGGVPGSGKTAAGSSILGSLVSNPAVQFAIFDGKGGDDWRWIEPRSFEFCTEDEDLEEVAARIRPLYNLMRARVKQTTAMLGASNVWDVGVSPVWPLVVVVIDECQTFLDQSAAPREDRAVIAEITKMVASFVRKGRSVGFLAIVTTQKPTSDSLPTQIRDNAAIKGALALETNEGQIATLGASVTESEVQPISLTLPKDQGVMVTKNGQGAMVRVRVPYVSPANLRGLSERHLHLTADPTELLSQLMGGDSDVA